MNAWLASPYRAIGVYIGGANRGCAQPNLTATWVQDEVAAGWQLGVKTGNVISSSPNHGWVLASYIVVGVMSVIALGLLEPANIAVIVLAGIVALVAATVRFSRKDLAA